MRQLLFSRPLILALGLGTAIALTTPLQAQNQPRKTTPLQTQQVRQKPTLDLIARDTRRDRAAVSEKSLTIASLDIAIKVYSGSVETTFTARFDNPNDAILEGNFTIDLPREAWVTGFALDVNGVLVDGVLQPKAKATEAYEENLRRGVDPGLGEVNAANQFRTRIFPINPRSGRTIKITYVSTLDATGAYTLPLTTAGAVGQVNVQITNQGDATPVMRLPVGLGPINPNANAPNNGARRGGFYPGDGQTVANVQGQNVALSGELKLSNLGRTDTVSISTTRGGDQYFSFVVPPAPISSSKPKIIRLYWDSSRSRRDDDLAKEISLLERYIAQVGPDQLDLVLFSDEEPRTIRLNRANMNTLSATLRDVRYQGASRFGDLERASDSDADLCLIFSDGQLTMDAFGVRQWPCKVVTISTSPNARRDILEGLASANRGTFIDLKSASIAQALSALQIRGPDLRSLVTNSGTAVDYTVNVTADGNFSITGPKPDANELVAKGYGQERRLSLQSATTSAHAGAAALWGISQIKRMSATDNPDTDALLAAVRRYGVATPDYSYIVLENVEDYARNNIAPSPTIGKDFLAQYQTRRTQIEAGERAAKDARLQTILTQWNEQKTWWKTRFAPQAPSKTAPNGNDNSGVSARVDGRVNGRVGGTTAPQETSPARVTLQPPPPPAPPPPPPAPTTGQPIMRDSASAPSPQMARTPTDAAQVSAREAQSISGATQRAPDASPTSPGRLAPSTPSTITISTATWNPNRPYLIALSEVKSGEEAVFEGIYRAQEVRFGDTPAFYFDMAEWAFRNGLQSRSAAIARNALELSNTTIDTKIILASRLVRYGDYARAIWLNERILQATPTKPQALRNLALSIVEATDAARSAKTVQGAAAITAYQRALGLLMKIVLTPNNGDYDGIELIALMEANHVVATLKSLGVSEGALSSQIDSRLVSLLAVDIRVTLEWNTDKTDMDLWVDEPTGERAIFNNPRTAIGGRLSNDMTRGYGPEEYLLNQAPDGLYKVLSNAYAADRLDPNGPTSLTVKLYRDWGRSTQKVESFVVELNRGQQNATTEIGRFMKGATTQPTAPNERPVGAR